MKKIDLILSIITLVILISCIILEYLKYPDVLELVIFYLIIERIRELK